ncbi:MAG: C40 family peptidase, partial [Spirochaetales bacterium]|nr:C40 family peptidase [Spirochaetales bacterium]
AKKIAADNSYIYVPQSKDNSSPANKCCICNKYGEGKYHGFNCIRFMGAAYFHGAGIQIKSANHKLVSTDMANKMLQAKPADALKIWEDRNGKGWKVIKNSNKKIPASQLKNGDILICYDKETSKGIYKHMALYLGDGKICDANSGTGISVRNYSSLGTKCLIAMRYIK